MQNLCISLSFRQTKFKVSLFECSFQGLMSFYAVAKGRSPGIYMTWDECKAQVDRFSGPVYKKFKNRTEAEEFIKNNAGATSTITAPKAKLFSFSAKKTSACNKSYSLLAGSTSKRLMSSFSDSDNDSNEMNQRKKKKKLNEPSPSSSASSVKNQFTVDENGYTEVYTDGACSSNGRGNAKAGIGIWFSDNNPYNVSQPVIGRATNNMAEIQAVTIAARQAQKAGIKKLKINTDSQFLISCITKWMLNWKKRGWLTAKGEPVKNKEELMEMEKALAPLKVAWNHVRGHIGIHGNEMADKLARDGCEHYKNK